MIELQLIQNGDKGDIQQNQILGVFLRRIKKRFLQSIFIDISRIQTDIVLKTYQNCIELQCCEDKKKVCHG